MLPAVYCGLESSALPYSRTRQKPANETGLRGGNLQAMLVLQTNQKNTPKADGVVMTTLPVAQTASQCTTTNHSGRWREREREYPIFKKVVKVDGFHSDTD